MPGNRRLPRFLQPQLARAAPSPPPGDNWLHEIKYDGYRILSRIENGKVVLLSRNGKDWTAKFSLIAEALGMLRVKSAWLDGEVSVLLPDGTTGFQQLQEAVAEGRQNALVYFLFDLLYLDGADLTGLALSQRKEKLRGLLAAKGTAQSLRFSDHVQGHGAAVFEQACRLRLEGVVSKRADASYYPGRGPQWLKAKCVRQQEFVVAGFTEPAGGRRGFGALLLGVYGKRGGGLRYAGRVGTGFTERVLEDLRHRLEHLETDRCPFERGTPAASRAAHWVRPRLVVEVRFAGWTRDGVLRMPSYRGIREDKEPEQVYRERIFEETAAEARPTERERKASARALRQVVAGLHLSNPDKVLYPEEGLTKRDLARYYEAVAPWMLPHLANRPLMLLRCPDGYQEGCFVQKRNDGGFPDAVQWVRISDEDGLAEYPYVRDERGLVALIQMGTLELHTRGCRVDRVESPDQVIFDLDPDEDVPWHRVTTAAQTLRVLLDGLGLASFLRTTGGKGLHVVLPLRRRHSWEEVENFSRAVAELFTEAVPGEYTISPSRRIRRGKIFVDYLRNVRGATAIANYSTRARPGAPVAVPLAWEELEREPRADYYNVRNVMRRLRSLPHDPWQDYPRTRQSITQRMRRLLQI